MLEEADMDRSGGLDRQEFQSLIRRMRMMEQRPEPAHKAPPPQQSLVFSGVPAQGPAVLHGQG